MSTKSSKVAQPKTAVNLLKPAPATPAPTATTTATAVVEPVKRAASKSPKASPKTQSVKKVVTKKATAKAPAKSPAKTPRAASKSPKATAVKKTAKKVVKKSKDVKGKKAVAGGKKAKAKRVHNTKPTQYESTGIGIGPARVKSVLTNVSLNPREHSVRVAIEAAMCKPKRVKPTADNPSPVEVENKTPVPVNQIPAEFLAVVTEAETEHEDALREQYERLRSTYVTADERNKSDETKEKYMFSTMSKDTADRYAAELKEAHKTAKAAGNTLNVRDFNVKFDKNFYADYAKFRAANDSYIIQPSNADGFALGANGAVVVNAEGEPQKPKYNEWTRATALVNKLCIRLSGNTRNIIACFLDRIVEQYARNGIHNCLAEGLTIVQLRHALTESDGFTERVPLDRFVKTFDNYGRAVDWIQQCSLTTAERQRLRANKQDAEAKALLQPKYPSPNYTHDFYGYVGELCKSIRKQMANAATNEADKERFMKASISREFRAFGSHVVYEAILRIGACLKQSVDRANVKTISDEMVYYVLRQLHNVCGMDYELIRTHMETCLKKFGEFKIKRKEERSDKRTNKQKNAAQSETEEVEEEEEEVEEEVEEDDEAEDEEEDIEVQYEDA